ncbi:MAG: PDZ domain-containing protein [Leptospiraceae bacterium]|nr:PDZ domain-containing protein [Leptospiraceae bacterium]
MKNFFPINYRVDATHTIQHYFHIKCQFTSNQKETILRMPNWTPGSYMIREYSRFLHGFQSENSWSQTDLAEWTVLGEGQIEIEYAIYAFEDLTVRTNYLDSDFGLITPAALFLQVITDQDVNISIEWKLPQDRQVYSPLKNKNDDLPFFVKGYDLLYDSPFLITDQKPTSLNTENTTHEILIQSEMEDTLKKKLCEDLKVIVELQAKILGGSPNDYYLFILILTEGGYGGLEHSACSVNIFDASKLKDRNEYLKLLELLCHEYFHLWNIKRIRPKALGPFDYSKPNLTKELWIAEGITSFYDAYFLLQAGFLTIDEYLAKIYQDINLLEDNSGEEWMSLEESSFTAWTKYYKRTSDSHNTGISYYTKGGVLVLCMQIRILIETNGKKSFMDIMKKLYQVYYLEQQRGFTKQEFFQIASDVTGLNLLDEFNIYLTQNVRIPVLDYLAKLGISSKLENPINELGFTCRESNRGLFVNKIFQKRIDPLAEIYLADEILAIDDFRITSNSQMQSVLETKKENSNIKILLARKSKLKHINLKLGISFKDRSLVFTNQESMEANPYWDLFYKIHSR